MHQRKKAPQARREPSGAKEPRAKAVTDDQDLKSERKPFDWSLDEFADFGGKWDFTKKVFRDYWCTKIVCKFKNFETMTWAEIANATKGQGRGTKHHHVAVSDLSKAANKRLKKIKRNDLDQLYSLRLGGKIRIYGVLEGTVLKVLWYDPQHEVCPSKPK